MGTMMASDQNPPLADRSDDSPSRRGFLQKSVCVTGAAAIASAVSGCATSPPVRGTTSKDQARYQDKPSGISRCGFCRHFYSPDICEVVAGPVSPRGWCPFYTFL
jgi:hypothetical protein